MMKRRFALGLLLLLGACDDPEPQGYLGYVEADTLYIGADEAGRVEEMSWHEGDLIAAGQILFRLDDSLQKVRVAAAEAALAKAEAELTRLKDPRQMPQEIAVLEAGLTRAKALRDLAEADLARQATLVKAGTVSQATYDRALAERNARLAEVTELERQIVVAGLPARAAEIAGAQQNVAAHQAELDQAKLFYARRQVVAPASGVIQEIYYRPGEVVEAGKAIVALLPPAAIKLRFYVPEGDLAKISIGQTVSATCDGCAEPISARITFIAREAEFTPPVIYSLEERAKLVFLVEAQPEKPELLRLGLPLTVQPLP